MLQRLQRAPARQPATDQATLADPRDGIEIAIPRPDGTYQTFRLLENDLFSPELAEKFPQLNNYTGTNVDGSPATIVLEISPKGVFVQVFGPDGTFNVNPFGTAGNDNLYASFDKRDYGRGANDSPCLVPLDPGPASARRLGARKQWRRGGAVRTYRLAVAATGEYTQFHGGTKLMALAAIQTTMNRVNQIYESELSIRFRLVGDNDKIIYTDGTADPFDNNKASTLIGQSQTVIDREIGDANYDIGHTFSTGAGGLASPGAAQPRRKARGVTGSGNPIGDPYDVDYVAHEVGHQFGANHTFNGVHKDCRSSNRNESTAYEPGSGTTILSYAGICGPDDIQANSNAYFHFESLQEIADFVTGTPGHPPAVTNGNNPPTVEVEEMDGGVRPVIPRDTPFTIRASGFDADGDPLVFNWEQADLGPAIQLGSPDNGASPLFRSVTPTRDGFVRTLPRLADILHSRPSPNEILPSTNRSLKFRVLARDYRFGGGGVASDLLEIDAVASAGPFRVYMPPAGSTHSGYLLVSWDVANTAKAPVNERFVNILLSSDGGQSFSHVLARSTPNDGNELLMLPSWATGSLMRIKVEAADGMFFSVSPGNFTVQPFMRLAVVVRHAEKAAGADPGLTTQGKVRADTLARLLFTRIAPDGVFATKWRRTKETAKPSAQRLPNASNAQQPGPITEYETAAQLAEKIKTTGFGSRLLVVGHSDSVPKIIRALEGGGHNSTSISEEDYGSLFVVAMHGNHSTVTRYLYTPEGHVTLPSD